jgi:photosystem II stability/assembly factor-like uncharacterized protein
MNRSGRFIRFLFTFGVPLLFGLSSALLGTELAVWETRDRRGGDPEVGDFEKEERESVYPNGAWRFRRLQLQDEKGYIPADGLERARRHMALMRGAQEERRKTKIQTTPLAAGVAPDSWVWLGPGNIGGRIRSIVINPLQTSTMFAGSVGGGIWRTTNGGTSWLPVNDFMANLAVSTIALYQPSNPLVAATLYAGTGESFASNFGSPGGAFTPDGLLGSGVFKSTDSGVTWNQLPTTNPADPLFCPQPATPANCPWLFVNRITISPDSNTILAATGFGIQRSTDGGTFWNAVGGFVGSLLDIDFHPTNNQQAIAGGIGFANFSTDNGQTWGGANFNPGITGRVEIAYAPSNPATVYAAVDQNNGEIYRSTDGGQNYIRVNTGTNFFSNALGSQGSYDNIIWVNPQDPTFLVVGGIDLWRSTDSGTSFTQISRWQNAPATSAHADQHMIVAHPGFDNNTNRTVYFGNDGGVYRTDNVATVAQTSGWINLNNNLGITQFYGVASNFNGVIIGGTQDNGTVRYTLSSNFTSPPGGGGDGGYCAADQTDPNYFYGEFIYLTIYRSTDTGQNFSNIFAGISDANNASTANFIAPFVLDPINPSTMLAGGLSLWRSNDVKNATPTWNSVPKPNAANSLISAITISPGSSNFVLVGHNNGDIYKTTDGTAGSPNWTKIDTAGLPNRFVTRLTIDNTRTPNWIYATFGGFNADNVYRSTDLGATWLDITGSGATGLPDVPVRSLVYHPRFPNFLYVGTEVGVFTSENAGATWELPQDGPANVSVDELVWRYQATRDYELIAATHGRGLYLASGGVYVDCNYVGFERGTFDQPYRTITAAINASDQFRTIWVRPCNYNEQITTSKRVEFRTLGGTVHIGSP